MGAGRGVLQRLKGTSNASSGANNRRGSKQAHAQYKRNRREENKKILVKENGGECIRCGYKKTISALHFHHRTPRLKLFSIAEAFTSKSLNRIRKEAQKCDLLCSNCHGEEHEIPISTEKNPSAVRQRYYRARKSKLVRGHGGICLVCGYNKSMNSLQFHHLDPSNKKFMVSGNAMCRKWSDLWAETRKCILLCGNCHSEVEIGSYSKTQLKKLQIKSPPSDPGWPLVKIKQENSLCLDCGVLLSDSKSERCRKHSSRMQEKISWPTSDELRKMLSQSNFSELGRKLGVSDNAIRKRLESHP